jgi:hypothetical protein
MGVDNSGGCQWRICWGQMPAGWTVVDGRIGAGRPPQTVADGGRQRRKEVVQRWRAAVVWMAVDGSSGIKLNVWVVVRNYFFCKGFAHGILFFCLWICPWLPPKKSFNSLSAMDSHDHPLKN